MTEETHDGGPEADGFDHLDHEVRDALATVRGHAQLLQRGVRARGAVEADVLARRADRIDDAVARIVRALEARRAGGRRS